MDMEYAERSKQNLQALMEGTGYKDRINKALDELQRTNHLNSMASEDQREVAKKTKKKDLFKKAGKFLFSAALLEVGVSIGVAMSNGMTGHSLLAMGAMATAGIAGLVINASQRLEGPYTTDYKAADSAARKSRIAGINADKAEVSFFELTELAGKAVPNFDPNKPETYKDMIDLEKRLTDIEAQYPTFKKNNEAAISNMVLEADEPKKNGFFNKLGNALKEKAKVSTNVEPTKGMKFSK